MFHHSHRDTEEGVDVWSIRQPSISASVWRPAKDGAEWRSERWAQDVLKLRSQGDGGSTAACSHICKIIFTPLLPAIRESRLLGKVHGEDDL